MSTRTIYALLAPDARVIYVGQTGNLKQRIWSHERRMEGWRDAWRQYAFDQVRQRMTQAGLPEDAGNQSQYADEVFSAVTAVYDELDWPRPLAGVPGRAYVVLDIVPAAAADSEEARWIAAIDAAHGTLVNIERPDITGE